MKIQTEILEPWTPFTNPFKENPGLVHKVTMSRNGNCIFHLYPFSAMGPDLETFIIYSEESGERVRVSIWHSKEKFSDLPIVEKFIVGLLWCSVGLKTLINPHFTATMKKAMNVLLEYNMPGDHIRMINTALEKRNRVWLPEARSSILFDLGLLFGDK